MCGIFGAIGDYKPKEIIVLALLNESRGRDSVGFYNGREIFKANSPAREVIHNPLLSEKHPFIMGHTRFATHGRVTKENAHPFKYDSIIGAHNGVVSNFHSLKTKNSTEIYQDTNKTIGEMEVDSEIIFWGLNKHGLAFLDEVEAYWGLSWHDLRDPDIFWLSVHNHTLAMAQSKKGVIYYSSDYSDLERIGLKPFDLKQDCCYKINIKTLDIRKFKLKNLKSGFTKKDWRTTAPSRIIDYDNEESWAGYPYCLNRGNEEKPATQTEEMSDNIKRHLFDDAKLLDPLATPLTTAEREEFQLLEEKDEAGEPITLEEEQRYYFLAQKAMDHGDYSEMD